MSDMSPHRRRVQPAPWGTRGMRNPRAGVQRYDPNAEDIRTGKNNEEGQAQSPSSIDHGNLGGLGDDDHPQYLQKAGGQMTGQAKPALIVDGEATLLLLNTKEFYVFTGTTSTWTLPAISGNTGIKYWIKNRGSGNLTLQRAGSDNLYDTTTQTSITISAGQSAYIYNDGTYWLVLFKG